MEPRKIFQDELDELPNKLAEIDRELTKLEDKLLEVGVISLSKNELTKVEEESELQEDKLAKLQDNIANFPQDELTENEQNELGKLQEKSVKLQGKLTKLQDDLAKFKARNNSADLPDDELTENEQNELGKLPEKSDKLQDNLTKVEVPAELAELVVIPFYSRKSQKLTDSTQRNYIKGFEQHGCPIHLRLIIKESGCLIKPMLTEARKPTEGTTYLLVIFSEKFSDKNADEISNQSNVWKENEETKESNFKLENWDPNAANVVKTTDDLKDEYVGEPKVRLFYGTGSHYYTSGGSDCVYAAGDIVFGNNGEIKHFNNRSGAFYYNMETLNPDQQLKYIYSLIKVFISVGLPIEKFRFFEEKEYARFYEKKFEEAIAIVTGKTLEEAKKIVNTIKEEMDKKKEKIADKTYADARTVNQNEEKEVDKTDAKANPVNADADESPVNQESGSTNTDLSNDKSCCKRFSGTLFSKKAAATAVGVVAVGTAVAIELLRRSNPGSGGPGSGSSGSGQ